MTVVEKVKQRITDCPIGGEERNLLRGILGELSRNAQMDGVAFIRQWVKTNEDVRRRTRRNAKEAERIDFETDILRSILED